MRPVTFFDQNGDFSAKNGPPFQKGADPKPQIGTEKWKNGALSLQNGAKK
jgi:hypothetical protein